MATSGWRCRVVDDSTREKEEHQCNYRTRESTVLPSQSSSHASTERRENVLRMRIHYGGFFQSEKFESFYSGGHSEIAEIEVDELSYFGIIGIIKEDMHVDGNDLKAVQFRVPGSSLDVGLRYLSDDVCVKELLKYVTHEDPIDVYCSHTSLPDVHNSFPTDDQGTSHDVHILQGEWGGSSDESDHDYVANDDEDEDVSDIGSVDLSDYDSEDEEQRERSAKRIELLDYLTDDGDELHTFNERAKKYVSKKAICAGVKPLDMDSEYYDSSDLESYETGSDGEEPVRKKRSKHLKYNPQSAVPSFAVGQTFVSKKEAVRIIRSHAVKTHRELYFKRSMGDKIVVLCKPKTCPWRLYLSLDSQKKYWVVKTLRDEHNCLNSLKITMANAKWIADEHKLFISMTPKLRSKHICQRVKDVNHIDVSEYLARRARKRVFRMEEKNYEHQYSMVHRYGEELLRASPGSTVKILTHVPTPDSPRRFQRMYVCLSPLKKGFAAGCRQVVGVDGAFLKGRIKGEVLAAIGRDSNDQMYPIAWAQVQVETYDLWMWFLQLLQSDLDMGSGMGWVIMSDQQKVMASPTTY